MSTEGWIKLHREIFDSDIWHDVTTFRLFIYLIGMASHKDGLKYKGLTLNQGQYIRSYRNLADDLAYKEGRGYKKYSLNTIKRCVHKLVEAERVNVKETELGTLFTVVNYAKYQQFEVREEETKNIIKRELRTNSERNENEVRTNEEQEQELKNLRIKEDIYTTTDNARVRNEKNDAVVFYQNNIGVIRPIVAEEIIDWINSLGDEMVIEALKRAIAQNKPTWGYARGILQAWSNKGIKTIEQVHAEDIEFRNRKQSSFRGNRKVEIIPEWFGKQKQQKEKQHFEENPDEIMQRLQRHASVSGDPNG